MKRLIVALMLCTFATGAAFAETTDGGKSLSVRTFQFKYKDAERAAAAIKSLISSEGSMSIQPSTNALVVTDRAENLKTISAALANFDSQGKAVKLSIRLVSAGRSENPPSPEPELRDIAPRLAMLRYNSISSEGEANVVGREGEPGSADLGNGYRAEFRFGEYDPATDSIKLNDFKLSRIQNDQVTPLYKASLNLSTTQTVIFGATRTQGQRAVFLVFSTHR